MSPRRWIWSTTFITCPPARWSSTALRTRFAREPCLRSGSSSTASGTDRCRSTIRRPSTARTWSRNDRARRRAAARARRANNKRLDLAPRIRLALPLVDAPGVGAELPALPSHDPRDLLRRRAVARHHPGVGPLRRHGARAAGLRHASTLRLVRRPPGPPPPFAGARARARGRGAGVRGPRWARGPPRGPPDEGRAAP